jgi:hypothetical protein
VAESLKVISPVIQQCMKAGFLNELEIYVVPVLLRSGTCLLVNLGSELIRLERIRVVGSPARTQAKYRATAPVQYAAARVRRRVRTAVVLGLCLSAS